MTCAGGNCTLTINAFTQANVGTTASPDWQPLCTTVTVRNQAQGASCTAFLRRARRIDRIGNRIPLFPPGVMSVL